MACTCAHRYIQRHFNVRSRCSKVKVPLDAVLPGERPEMEKVYVDVPQIEYVLWPRWEGECSKYVKKSSTCCAFMQIKFQRLYMYMYLYLYLCTYVSY